MTFEELLGEVMASQTRMEAKVDLLHKTVTDLSNKWLVTNQQMNALPCNDELGERTSPDCPALLDSGEDEPHSVVTEQVSVHAGPLAMRGPGIMLAAIALIGAVGAVAWAWISGHVAMH